MASKWFYVENDNEVGPVGSAVIKQKVREGVIGPEDEVWKEGLPDWVPARKIKGLFPPGGAVPPPVPAAPQPQDDWLDDLGGSGESDSYFAQAAPLADRLNSRDGEAGDFVYAGFWERFVAAFVDGILMQIVSFFVGFVFGFVFGLLTGNAGVGPNGQMDGIFLALSFLIGIIVYIAYYAGMESSSKQATLGKQLMSMIVTDLDGNRISFGRAVGRAIAEYFLSILLLITYLVQPFTQRRQTLHDLIAGTLVVKR